mgnify:CR=1 FL=1
MARRRRRSPVQRALHAMAPHRVLWRAMSGPEVKRALKSTFATQTTHITAESRRADAERMARAAKKAAAGKKIAASKSSRRAATYAAALAIPGQNRAAAAKQAKAAAPSAGKKQVPVRGKGGLFEGSKIMGADDLAAYQRAKSRQVDPALLPRGPRRRG